MAEQHYRLGGSAADAGNEGSNAGEVDPGIGVDLEGVLGTAEVADETGATAGAGDTYTDTDNGGTGASPGTASGPQAAGGEAGEEL